MARAVGSQGQQEEEEFSVLPGRAVLCSYFKKNSGCGGVL